MKKFIRFVVALAMLAVGLCFSTPSAHAATQQALTTHCGVKAAWNTWSYDDKPYVKLYVYDRLTSDGQKLQFCTRVHSYKARSSDKIKLVVTKDGHDTVRTTKGRNVEIKTTMSDTGCIDVRYRYTFMKGKTLWAVDRRDIPPSCVEFQR